MVKPVAIYTDEGTSDVGVESLLLAVPRYLNRTAQPILAEQIIAGDLAAFSMLIVPGGADLPYCRKLNGAGNQAIRHFVESGGVYLGICAGAYYACAALDFVGREYQVKGTRELAFFDGLAQGCLPQWANGNRFDESVQSKAAVSLAFATGEHERLYYHGGPKFCPNPTACFEAIARYPDGELAMVAGSFGAGRYVLSGVHFELQAEAYQQIVQAAEASEQPQERQLAQLFRHDYGKLAWRKVQQAVGFC